MSNVLPLDLWTDVSVTLDSSLLSTYDSSTILMKSKRPSTVGFSIVKYSSIWLFTDCTVDNHSEPLDILIGKITFWKISSRRAFVNSEFEEYKEKTIEGEVLDSLGLNKMWCRRLMLTHVDIE